MKEAGVTPRKFMFGVMPGKRFIMAQQIVSLKHKTGTYEGNAYDNYIIHVVDYESTNKALVFGPDTDDIKVKADVFAMELGRNIALLADPSITGVKDIEGLLIAPMYNKFGTCTGFNLSLGASADDKPVAKSK